ERIIGRREDLRAWRGAARNPPAHGRPAPRTSLALPRQGAIRQGYRVHYLRRRRQRRLVYRRLRGRQRTERRPVGPTGLPAHLRDVGSTNRLAPSPAARKPAVAARPTRPGLQPILEQLDPRNIAPESSPADP